MDGTAPTGELAQQMRAQGVAELRDVPLPASFNPPMTDIIFIPADGATEVYMSARVAYRGPSAWWQAVQRSPEQPGASRLVGSAPGDIEAALDFLRDALEQAGDVAEAGCSLATQPETGPALRDLTRDIRAHDLVGRETELGQLVTSMLRETKPGVVLIGPAGCGKTTLVEMLAARIAAEDVPAALRGVPVYDLPLGSLLEDAGTLGGLERRLAELIDTDGRPIFFADELHQLARGELRPVADLIKPGLAAGRLRMIGASTPVEWRRITDTAFLRRLTQITVPEPTPAQTLAMLRQRVRSLSEHHGLCFSDDDLREAIALAARYLPARAFPDKAIDLLDHAAAMQLTASGSSSVHDTDSEVLP